MWFPSRWKSLFPQCGSLCCLLGFPGRPIWRCLKNLPVQPRHDCMSSPFVACFLSKYYRKKFISFKKNRYEKEQEFKSPRYWSGQQKKVMKYWLTITVIAHFPNILFPWRDTHLSTPSNLQDLNIFLQLRPAWLVISPAGMTCCEMRKCVVHLFLLPHVWLNYRKLEEAQAHCSSDSLLQIQAINDHCLSWAKPVLAIALCTSFHGVTSKHISYFYSNPQT